MVTLSRMILGRNPKRALSKGAFGNSSPNRKEEMIQRYNESFNKKLKKLRATKEKKIKRNI